MLGPAGVRLRALAVEADLVDEVAVPVGYARRGSVDAVLPGDPFVVAARDLVRDDVSDVGAELHAIVGLFDARATGAQLRTALQVAN